jgi:predicted TIM-barrel enzyme
MFEFVRLSKLTETSLKDVGLVEPGVLEWLLSKRSLVPEAPFADKFRTGS